MISTQTPLRISLAGGGTDMKSFYERHGGAVLSFAIDKFVYVHLNRKYDGKTRLSYRHTENVDDPKQLQHDIVRETLGMFQEKGVEIATIADLPGNGTGLGSSSALAVGLVNAICSWHGNRYPPKLLAETAYTIEHDLCRHAVGKQDQYASAFGDIHYYQFSQDHVQVTPVILTQVQVDALEKRLILFHIDKIRDSQAILSSQEHALQSNRDVVEVAKTMATLACELKKEFDRATNSFSFLGEYLHEGWHLKRRLSDKIADSHINSIYNRAINAGARGGKLCGAGGGGFMLFYASPDKHDSIREAVGLRQVPFKIWREGSRVIFNESGTR